MKTPRYRWRSHDDGHSAIVGRLLARLTVLGGEE